MTGCPIKVNPSKPFQDQIYDLHKGISQLWGMATGNWNENIALKNEIESLNKTIIQLSTKLDAIKGHSSIMPDTKGENPDHDRRYQKKIVNPSSEKTGADQVASGAIAGERWITFGHGILPDNVMMMGQ